MRVTTQTRLRVVDGRTETAARASEDMTQLVARTLAGDMGAWATIYEQHYDAVMRHVCYLTGDPSASEDVVQDTFAAALAALPRFEGRSAFSTWLLGVGINMVRKRRAALERASKTRARVAECVVAATAGDELDRRVLQRARKAALYSVLERLPVHLREAFVLREMLGLDVAEAAAQAGVSAGNMRIRSHRARKLVQEALVAAGWVAAEEVES